MWRLMEERDREAVEALHHKQEARLGRKFELPDLLSKPVVISVVREVKKRITHCIFLEAEIEACALATSPLPRSEMNEALNLLMPVVLGYKIGIARAFVPRPMTVGKRGRPAPVVRILEKAGFTQDNDYLVPFFRRFGELPKQESEPT